MHPMGSRFGWPLVASACVAVIFAVLIWLLAS